MVQSWQDIPYTSYLTKTLKLNEVEENLLQRLLDKLPEDVIDSHTHIARYEDVEQISSEELAHPVSTYPVFSLEDAEQTRSILWKGKRVRSCRMAHAIGGYKHTQINEYILKNASRYSDFTIAYGIPDDITYTSQLIEKQEICALKMYFKYQKPYATRILDVFPPPILEHAQSYSVPIILHLPVSLPKSIKEVIELLELFPNLPVILAHLGGHGGQRFKPEVVPAYEQLKPYKNLYLDTAFVYDSDLIASALAIFGYSRILFGTDEPLSLIRAINYQHPKLGHRLFAPQYHWATNDAPPAEIESKLPILLHIQQIDAVLSALKGHKPEAVEAVFYHNAHQFVV